MRFPAAILLPDLMARLSRRRSRKGQTLVEYALVLAVLCVVLVFSFTLLGQKIVVVFSDITAILDTAQGSH